MAVLALLVRLYGIGNNAFWYDEVMTQKRASLPFAELLADSFGSKHYPLYFLLTKPLISPTIWESGLRVPSAVFGAVGVLMAARIAFELGGRSAALVTGALLAFSPIEVQYGQEARPYTLVSAAILIAVWGLVRLLQPGSSREQPGNQAAWIAYAAGTAIALNSLGAAAAFFLAVNLIVIGLAATRRLPAGWSMKIWIAVNASVLIVWLPGLVSLLLANTPDATRGLRWIQPLTAELAWDVIASLYMLHVPDQMTFERLAAPLPLLGFVVVGLAAAGVLRLARTPAGIMLVGLAFFMPVALALISLTAMPAFVPRYMLWSTGPFFILAGVGIVSLSAQVARRGAAAALFLGAAYSLLPYYGTETKPRWDLATAHLAQRAGLGDTVVSSGGLVRVMLDAYMVRHSDVPLEVLNVHSRDEIVRAFQKGATVWVVYGRAGQGSSISREDLLSQWPELGPGNSIRTFGRYITISQHNKRRPLLRR